MNDIKFEERLNRCNENIIATCFSNLKNKLNLSEKIKIAHLKIYELDIIISMDDNFIYFNGKSVFCGLSNDDMYYAYRMMFNIFDVLYGNDFKIDHNFAK